MLCVAAFCLLPASGAEAATAKKLFTAVLNDGSSKRSVMFYEYEEKNGTSLVKPKNGSETITVSAAAKKVSVSLKGKTAYFKNNYKSITYKKSETLSAITPLSYTLKKRDGTVRTAELTLNRPTISFLEVTPDSSAGFTPGGSNRLTVKTGIRSQAALKSLYQVQTMAGKVIYQKTLGTKKNVNYTATWSGKPSKGNTAGMSETEYVPAGTYKVVVYLQYDAGGEKKYIGKSIKIRINKVNTAQVQTSVAKKWNWDQILTGDDTVDYLAEMVCQKVLKNGMNEIERARALYRWCGEHMTYSKATGAEMIPYTSSKAKKAIEAYGKEADELVKAGRASINYKDSYFASATSFNANKKGWIKRGLGQWRGDCFIMSFSYQVLCRHAGIEADVVENSLPSGASPGHHMWNVVKIGGSYYYTDVNQAESQFTTLGEVRYEFFLGGTNYFYQYGLYNTVKSKFTIAASVSKTNCPGRI